MFGQELTTENSTSQTFAGQQWGVMAGQGDKDHGGALLRGDSSPTPRGPQAWPPLLCIPPFPDSFQLWNSKGQIPDRQQPGAS